MQNVTQQLREQLTHTLSDLRQGKIDAHHAAAVSKLADSIIKTVIVEIQAAKILGIEQYGIINGETPEQRRQRQGGIIHKLR